MRLLVIWLALVWSCVGQIVYYWTAGADVVAVVLCVIAALGTLMALALWDLSR